MLPVLRCEVIYFHLTPLFTYILSNFLELISNGRSERLAKLFSCSGCLVVYFAVNRKIDLPLLSHREHRKAGVYCTIFELPVTFELCVLRGLIYNKGDKRVPDL